MFVAQVFSLGITHTHTHTHTPREKNYIYVYYRSEVPLHTKKASGVGVEM